MGKTSDDTVKHVISFRVNEEERGMLDDLSIVAGVSISTLLRESIDSLKEQVQKKSQAKYLARKMRDSVYKF